VPGRHVKTDTNRDSRTNWAPTCLCHVEVDVRGRFGSNRWLLRADVESGDAVGARGLSRPGDVLVGMADGWGTVASSRILLRRAGWGLREPGVATVVRRLTNSEMGMSGLAVGTNGDRRQRWKLPGLRWCWCGGDADVVVLGLLSLWSTGSAPSWSWACWAAGEQLTRGVFFLASSSSDGNGSWCHPGRGHRSKK
jgi:hypothetical protein